MKWNISSQMKKRKQTTLASRLILPALFTVLVPAAAGAQKIEPLKIGEPAPDFNLLGVDGRHHTLAEYGKAELLVLVFTCNHCPTAQYYEERIIEVVKDYKKKGVAFVAISPNDAKALRLNEMGYTDVGDSTEDNVIRAKHRKFNFPYLYDGDVQLVSKAYGPRATPHVFVFDKERKLRYEGGIDDSKRPENVKTRHLRDTLDALLAGKTVPREQTPTFGCSIKWSDKRDNVAEWMKKLAAEPVNLEPIGPKEVSALLKNDSDKLRLINLWATWCGPCREEFPELVTINRMYRHRGFELITISIDEPGEKEKVRAYLEEHQASNRNYLFNSEDQNALVKALNEEWQGAVPFTILVRPGGEIAYRNLGGIDPLEAKRAIVDILGRYK